jgi:hypothetical protein
MQFLRRPLAPNELDHELIWLSVSLGSLALAFVWFKLGLPWPTCAFHDLTGLPCVTCGATRSAIAFFHGNFLAAMKWNPFAFLCFCGLSIFDAYAAGVLITRAPRFRFRFTDNTARAFARFANVCALGLNWIYLLSHYQTFA